MNKIATLLLTLTMSASSFSKQLLITPKNSVIINEAISSGSVDRALKELVELNRNRKSSSPIYIVLNSPGGSIMAGNKLINFVNTLENIHTVCMFCASMAHAISQGVKGTRYATHDNIMMAHRAKGGFSGQFEDGEVESRLKLFKALVRSMELRNADRIGISLRSYKEKVKDEWWTYGEDSEDLDIVDELVSIKCSQELIDKKVKSVKMTMFGPIQGEETSACPLL